MDLTVAAIAAIAAAAVLAAVHLLAGRLTGLHVVPRSRWLSLAGGASVAYVFVHLLPELAEHQEGFSEMTAVAFLEHHVWLVALAGFATFYGLEQLARRSRGGGGDGDVDGEEGRAHHREEAPPAPAAVFWVHMGSFTLYNALIGYLLVQRGSRSLAGLALYAAAMGLHLLVNDHGLRDHHRRRYDRLGRWILASALLGGLAVGFAVELPDAAVGVLLALLGGSVVLNVIKEELPEERESRWWAFALGAVGYAGLLVASGKA